MPASERDRTTVRRGLRAGLVATLAVGLPLVGVTLLRQAELAGVALVSAIVVGILVAAGWLLLAVLLDVWAGEFPGVRRAVITGVFAVLALLGPYVVLIAAAAAR